jgi:hypothetical protein
MSTLLVLMIGGGGAGLFAARLAADGIGLVALEPALVPPVAIAGIATGGMAGLTVALGGIAVRDRVGGHKPLVGMRVILACVAATALGAVLYLGVVGGLVWLVGLILPDAPATVVAVFLSIVGLPFVGPVAYQLITARSADELDGGTLLPTWVRRLRRRS